MENLLLPVFKVATINLQHTRDFVTVAITSPKKTFLEEVVPTISTGYKYLQQSTIFVKENIVKFHFSTEFFKENATFIINEIAAVKETVMKSHLII